MDSTDLSSGQGGKMADVTHRFRWHPHFWDADRFLAVLASTYVAFCYVHIRWFRSQETLMKATDMITIATNKHPQHCHCLFCLEDFASVAFHGGHLPRHTRARAVQSGRRIFPIERPRGSHDADAHRLSDRSSMCHSPPALPLHAKPPATGDLRTGLAPLPHLVVLPPLPTASHRADMVK